MKKGLPLFLATLGGALFGFFLKGWVSQPAAVFSAHLQAVNQSSQTCEPESTQDLLAVGKRVATIKTALDLSYSDLVGNLSPAESSLVIDKFLSDNEQRGIIDTQRFVSRIAEVFEEPTYGQTGYEHAKLFLGRQSSKPEFESTSITGGPKEPVYIHIELSNDLALADNYFFIRWRNSDSGDIVLFDRKQVLPGKDNWVSYLPNEGWQEGMYDVTFYRLNDELTPLASLQYFHSMN